MHETLSNFRDALLKRRSDILTQVARASGRIESQSVDGVEPDFTVQSVELETLDLLFRLDHLHRLELSRINEVIERIDSGCYGTCLRCGDAIEQQRLQVLPCANTCARCANARDEFGRC